MSANGRFKPGQSGNPKTRFKPGNPHTWQPGQFGKFERVFYESLLGQGAPPLAGKRTASTTLKSRTGAQDSCMHQMKKTNQFSKATKIGKPRGKSSRRQTRSETVDQKAVSISQLSHCASYSVEMASLLAKRY